MHAQITYFDGPRSDELVAAAARAGKERITPLLLGDDRVRDEHVATYVLHAADGGEIIVSIMRSPEGLDRCNELILHSELLPGEDPALLPGPDRVERYPVVHAVEHGRLVEQASS